MIIIGAGILLIVLGIIGACYGYGRGRGFVVAGGLMILMAIVNYAIAVWSFALIGLGPALLYVMLATILFGVCLTYFVRRRMKRAQTTSQHVLWRYAGLCLGLACAPCVGLLLGAIMQSASAPAQPHGYDHWAGLQQFGRELSALSSEMLEPLPLVGERAEEFHALMQILNTPPEILAAYAKDHELALLIERPVVRAALLDVQLGDDIAALANGNLLAINRIMRAPTMRAVLADEKVLELARRIDLQELAAELSALKKPILDPQALSMGHRIHY